VKKHLVNHINPRSGKGGKRGEELDVVRKEREANRASHAIDILLKQTVVFSPVCQIERGEGERGRKLLMVDSKRGRKKDISTHEQVEFV